MKRSGALSRGRSSLARHKPLRSHGTLRRKTKSRDKGHDEQAWKTPRKGCCAVCGAFGWLQRHHVTYASVLKREGRSDLLWDQRNALDVGAPATCACHANQHWASKRIPRSLLSVDAREFMVEALGADKALLYVLRFYGADEGA